MSNQQKNSNITAVNDLYSSASSFLKVGRLVMRENHTRLLELTEKSKSLQLEILDSNARARSGRRPQIHIETGLLERVNKAGLGHLVQQFEPIEFVQFENSLSKAEDLMISSVKFNGNEKALIQAAVNVQKSCKFPKEKFIPVSVQKAADEQVNASSSSGFPLYTRKGLVLPELIEKATSIFNGFGDFPKHHPLSRGFRLQLREGSDGTINLKVRVMYPYPGVIVLLEDVFIMPFIEHFIKTDTFYIIGRSGKEIGQRLKVTFNKKGAKRITSSDISSFDQNTINDLIILSFWILRSQLRLSSTQHKLFMQIMAYFGNSIVLQHVGRRNVKMFVKDHGIPSGSGFTNMIGSFCNAIAFEYCIPGIVLNEQALICGDDNIFNSTSVDFNKLVITFKNVFNYEIDPIKTKHFNRASNLHFLGFDWKDFERYQSPKLLINQLLWHSTFRTDLNKYDRELARGASVLLNAKNGQNLFKRIFPDVISQLNLGIDIRFWYLFGNQPVSSSREIQNLPKGGFIKAGSNLSLKQHLTDGWNIR